MTNLNLVNLDYLARLADEDWESFKSPKRVRVPSRKPFAKVKLVQDRDRRYQTSYGVLLSSYYTINEGVRRPHPGFAYHNYHYRLLLTEGSHAGKVISST